MDQIHRDPEGARSCIPFLFTDVAKLVVAHARYVIATVLEGDEGVAAIAPI